MSTPGKKETPGLSSKAWLRHGPKGLFGPTDPGLLLSVGDRVSFVTRDGPVFEADRAEIRVKWPRSEFGGGIHLTVDGKIYRLSLARPPHAAEMDTDLRKALSEFALENLSDWYTVGAGFRDVHEGRASGKAWKAYFGAEMAEAAAEPDTAAGHETGLGDI
jgi:hypothetical protein